MSSANPVFLNFSFPLLKLCLLLFHYFALWGLGSGWDTLALSVAQTDCNNIPCLGVSLWNVGAVGRLVLQPLPITQACGSMELGGLLRGFGKCVGRIISGKTMGRMLCAGAGQ